MRYVVLVVLFIVQLCADSIIKPVASQNVAPLKGQAFFDFYIKDKPKGIVRDFYIWQYLNENQLNSQQIHTAYALLNAKNPYLNKVLDRLGSKEPMPRDIECSKMDIKRAFKEDEKCLSLASVGKLKLFKTMPKKESIAIADKLANAYPHLSSAIRILSSSQFYQEILQANAVVFTMVYDALSLKEKQRISQQSAIPVIEKLSQQNHQPFFNMLNTAALNAYSTPLKKILLHSDIIQAPHNTLFLLGLNELQFGSKQKALRYMQRVQNSKAQRFFIDRALLWQYLITQNQQFLQEILASNHVNIFSLFAAEKLAQQPNFKIVHSLPSISTQKPPFDATDPYVWQNISSTQLSTTDVAKLTEIIPYFSYQETMPQLAFLMQKINKFTINYFIVPFENLVSWDSREQKSFVLAIARQESHFIPTLISRSFALGMMQIMPAYVKPFAEEMGRNDIEYNDLFQPKIALEMGRHYIRKLQKEYKHPLFVAYAYNGGPTFLRKLLAKEELFLKNRQYEPWLSLELIPYEETRFYGMRVLANYIIYEKYFGGDVNLEKLLQQTLIYPKK
ncbi:lytic transglycosylase domain-containing protein [Helicobacter monodelphidis]|uniref:lytic transglycosylase domain-containing protein n=1 Tax=Helicobacter sp. 15-1451 TaxID=2004995 RepID=UPI00215D2BF4|nr:lytic transglycosylase domain-containing protein [Helicobacter sp. 15-1451]